MTVTLHQFAYSHFNEKARWVLDVKGIEHQRETYLPGPHVGAMKRLSGQTQTPVLEIDGEVIAGSAAIIDHLEARHPQPPLYPVDPGLREQALALQKEMDASLGPDVRTLLFSALVNEGSYLCNMFAGGKGLAKRLGYRAMFPVARGVIARGNGVTPENVARCKTATRDWLDRIAEQTRDTGYLVGDTFSVADLAAAALLAPIANVSHRAMKRPRPIPQSVQSVLALNASHSTIAWVNHIYDAHRPAGPLQDSRL